MPSSTTTTVASVAQGRELIDDIDGRLLDLLAERRAVSTQIQALRVEAGGSRVEHSRENAVIRRWAEALGDGGAELALAVLGHCRGRRCPSANAPSRHGVPPTGLATPSGCHRLRGPHRRCATAARAATTVGRQPRPPCATGAGGYWMPRTSADWWRRS